jgi:alanine racemase
MLASADFFLTDRERICGRLLLRAILRERGVLAMGPGAVLSDNQGKAPEPLVVSGSTEINGSLSKDAIVQKNCSLHVRGSIAGSLTIERGADVIVDGSVHGKIINRGGRLVVSHKGLTACVVLDGPSESEAGAVLRINLTAIAFNWETLAKSTAAECAAVLQCNGYGCGIDPIAEALAKSGCRTFFVTNLSEARRVRSAAPRSTIYVRHGFHVGAGPVFAELDVRPVINSSIELAEWDAFKRSAGWTGSCGLNVDTGANRLGLSMEEAAALASRLDFLNQGITLLMSRLADADEAHDPRNERQIALFRELRRLYVGVPASLANTSAILRDPRCHFDVVRAGSALFGINPTPGSANPMLPVVDLHARIVQVRDAIVAENPGDNEGRFAKRRRRIAFVSFGYGDGLLRPSRSSLHAVVGGHRCPTVECNSLDLLPIDVTDLPDPGAAGIGEMVTLIGSSISIDEVAEATKSTGREVLAGLGSRFHRIYYAT